MLTSGGVPDIGALMTAGSDFMTLVKLMRDPAAFEKMLAAIKEAHDAYKSFRDEQDARARKLDAVEKGLKGREEAAAQTLATIEDQKKTLAAAQDKFSQQKLATETSLDERAKALNDGYADLDRQRAEFDVYLRAQIAGIDEAKAAHENDKVAFQAKVDVAMAKRTQELDDKAEHLRNREESLLAGEKELEKKTKVVEAMKKDYERRHRKLRAIVAPSES